MAETNIKIDTTFNSFKEISEKLLKESSNRSNYYTLIPFLITRPGLASNISVLKYQMMIF